MIELPDLKSDNDLFIFLLHTISERFRDHAILKGGMVLRLLGSKRQTLDLDYTFIPFTSKKEVQKKVAKLFSEIVGMDYKITTNSKAIKVNIAVNDLRSQVEINVAKQLKSDVISTSNLKDTSNPTTPRIIRIMSLDVALSHKLAAWNERHLNRDLYDIYYFLEVQNVTLDKKTLYARLKNIQSRRPELKKIKAMSLEDFLSSLKKTIDNLKQDDLESELLGILDDIELPGLSFKIKDSINRFITQMNTL
ncbi:MAG: nucleotidyl transferase AbiEii/AbiGii toxin family protein [Bacteriovoracaceae bacterium]|nr:nucleotidyl transferase AbiEii/AbiGii toxin family protein [Bacteriovoracaceae bacterium]